mmetsp:Transcript_8982/g.39525  ORF Transcript_8982/g.39525 Transcript_8982/m.39525 type:complete len:307 (-) Transcript_8982:74-994(-)
MDELLVRLEVHHVHLVEPHERREKPDVRLGQHVAGYVPLLTQNIFAPVQTAEQFGHRGVVRPLRRRESALVHAVVDAVVHPLIDLVDGGPERLGVQVQLLVRGDCVELRVEVADDLAALVAHDRVRLLVPQDGHREPRANRRATHSPVVHIADESAAEERIRGARVRRSAGERTRARGPGDERAVLAHEAPSGVLIVRVVGPRALPRGMHGRDRDVLGESLEVEQGERAARPRARVGDVEVVPPALGGVWTVGSDPVAEDGILTDESAVLGDVRHGGLAGSHGFVRLRHRAMVNDDGSVRARATSE